MEYIAPNAHQEGFVLKGTQSMIIDADFNIVRAIITICSNTQICLSQECLGLMGKY